jgi:hypothetical protein
MTYRSILFATTMAAALGMGAPTYAQGLDLDLDAGVDVDIEIGAGGGGSDSGDESGAGAGEAAVGVGGGVGVQLNRDGGSGGAEAAPVAFANADAAVDLVISLIAESNWQGNEFGGAVTFDGAQAFSVAAWLSAETEARFRAALEQSWSQIQNLQAAIAANATMSAWLQAQGLAVSSVVAVGVNAEGQFVAFAM